jgi:hypothetical protein
MVTKKKYKKEQKQSKAIPPEVQALMGVLKCLREGREEDFGKAMLPLREEENANIRWLIMEGLFSSIRKAYAKCDKELTREDIVEAIAPIEGERTEKVVKKLFKGTEEIGKEIALRKVVLRRARKRFNNISEHIKNKINEISDMDLLDSLIDYIFESRTLDEFENAVCNSWGRNFGL